MGNSILDHIKKSIASSKQYNSSQLTAPNVILWPDPESQWISIIDMLRDEIPAFLTLGSFNNKIKQGPAIWLKCIVDKSLPEADWEENVIPTIYMPGISKEDFKKIEEATADLQPLMEYQFT
ncbi:MAG: BREX-1 system phosphatase PglZ type B, partial [Candidatus Scalindua sp.]